jgi:hypothetical protein
MCRPSGPSCSGTQAKARAYPLYCKTSGVANGAGGWWNFRMHGPHWAKPQCYGATPVETD